MSQKSLTLERVMPPAVNARLVPPCRLRGASSHLPVITRLASPHNSPVSVTTNAVDNLGLRVYNRFPYGQLPALKEQKGAQA